MLTPPAVISLIGLIINAIAVLHGIIPHFQRPQVAYYTNELPAYPTYCDEKNSAGDIRGKAILGGPTKILSVVVENKGKTAVSGVVVRIPWSTGDEFLSGRMTTTGDGSAVHVLDERIEYTFARLMPGDHVSFSLNLGNADSDLGDRIGVFYGDGRRVAYYHYVPVRYVGGNAINVSLRKSWIYLSGFMVIMSLILSASGIRRPKDHAASADRQGVADVTGYQRTSPLHSIPGEEKSRDRPPRERAASGQ